MPGDVSSRGASNTSHRQFGPGDAGASHPHRVHGAISGSVCPRLPPPARKQPLPPGFIQVSSHFFTPSLQFYSYKPSSVTFCVRQSKILQRLSISPIIVNANYRYIHTKNGIMIRRPFLSSNLIFVLSYLFLIIFSS